MARVPQYVQDKLASSLIKPVIDNSSSALSGEIAKDADRVANAAFELAAAKQKEVNKKNAQLKNINDTLTAYDRSIQIESEMYDIIDEEKRNNINNPQFAVRNVESRGRQLISDKLGDESLDPDVREKMTGIITNSFRGKISEMHSWQVGQDTANAKGKIASTVNSLATLASKTSDINQVLEYLDFPNRKYSEDDEAPYGDYMKFVYGNKGVAEIQKAQKEIAEAYLIGMLDRKQPNQVASTLESGVFDGVLSPDDKHAVLKMSNTMVKAEKAAAKRDNMFEVYDIRSRATVLASQGQYTTSQAIADSKRIEALGGNPSDLLAITNKAIASDKVSDKKDFTLKQQEAHDKVTKEWARISGKSGNIKVDTEIDDIVKFQELVENNRQYFTASQYDNYMTKLNKSRMKRVREMRTDWLGRPQGTLKGDDEMSKGYTAIYKFAQDNYKVNGKDDSKGNAKRLEAIDNMTGEFVRSVERAEAQTGKPLTEAQRQSIVNSVINKQAQRSNINLQNIPKNGSLFKDPKTNTVYRVFPDGRREVVK